MNKVQALTTLPLILLLALTACVSRDGGRGLCSSSRAESSLAPACSPLPPEPRVSPVGSWQGTLTTLSGGSGTRPFAAEIDLVNEGAGTYEGSLRVGTKVYRAVGGYNPYIGEDHFALRTSPAELDAALAPGPPFYGVEWYGELTDNTWEGEWHLRTEDVKGSQGGVFSLERLR